MIERIDNNAILVILDDGGDDDRLLGIYETETLDFKGAPYRLGEQREQWELAKDVAALANSRGGLIVIGVYTEQDPKRDEEVSSKVAPFAHELLDTKQVRDLVTRDVYPLVRELRIQVFERGEKRLAAISVPDQDADQAPFLVTRVFDDQADRQWHAFALPTRSSSHTQFEHVGPIHRDLADGRRSRQVEQRAAVPRPDDVPVREPRPEPAPEPFETGDAEEWLRAKANEVDRELGWDEYAVVYVAAVPASRRPRPRDFYAPDGVRSEFAYDHQLRRAGFGVTYDVNTGFEGESIVSVDPERRILRVDADGHVLAGAAGTDEFLGWGMNPGREKFLPGQALRVNPVVLSEWVYEFCRFVDRVVVPRWGGGAWTVAVMVRRAQSADHPFELPHRYVPGRQWAVLTSVADADERVDSAPLTDDPAVSAISLLSMVYALFGLGADAIPFNADGRFDEQQLLDL